MTLIAVSIPSAFYDIQDAIETYGSDNLRLTFLYDGKFRNVQPFKIDDHGNLSSAVHSESGSPFKKFSLHMMSDLHMNILNKVDEAEEDTASTGDDMESLRAKLGAIKILRPQHVAAVEALEDVATEVEEMYMTALGHLNHEVKHNMRLAADALRESIARSVVKLSV